MTAFPDNFNRANNASLGTNYTVVPSSGGPSPQILSNRVRTNNGATPQGDWLYLNTPTFQKDQDVAATAFVNAANDSYCGTLARASNAAFTTYYAIADAISAFGLGKVVTGTFTTITSDATVLANNTLVELIVTGTNLTAKQGTVTITGTDGAITSGQPGLVVGWNPGGADGDVELDDWVANDGIPKYPWRQAGGMAALIAQ
jgi:hypothetical protein